MRAGSQFAILSAGLLCCACSSAPKDEPRAEPDPHELLQVEFVGDPIEGANRVLFNTDFGIRLAISPVARGYRWVLPGAARSAVVRFRDNILFPGRFVNNLLQAKLVGAATETGRFVVNTTIGLLGLFDPARHFGLDPSQEDFGQTFAYWGTGPGFYLMIPVFGPSTGRDAVGTVGDTLLDPAFYVSPFLGIFFRFNHSTFTMDDYEMMIEGEADPYALYRDSWVVDRVAWIRDVKIETPSPGAEPLPELDVLFAEPEDPKAYSRADRIEFQVPGASDEEMEVSVRLAEERAPLVILLPGMGTFRDAWLTIAVAERLHAEGFAVATLSSTFNHEFIDGAATAAVPGDPPADSADVAAAVVAARRVLDEEYPDRLAGTSLLGISLGGVHALVIAGTKATEAHGLALERIVAVSPPSDPVAALERLDAAYDAPLRQWSDADRTERIENALLKLAVVSRTKDRARGHDDPPPDPLPFDVPESEYLVGTWYRHVLRSAILASQRRENLGMLEQDPDDFVKGPLYREITRISFAEYMDRFVVPTREERTGEDREQVLGASRLRAFEAQLKEDPRVRVLVSEDDFFLDDGQMAWLAATLGDRLTRLPDGGHHGPVLQPEGFDALVQALRGGVTNAGAADDPASDASESPPADPPATDDADNGAPARGAPSDTGSSRSQPDPR